MALTEGRAITLEENLTNPIYSAVASCFLILACQGETLLEANQRLRELKDKGYNIRGHRMRSDMDYPCGRSEALDSFVGTGEKAGYILESPTILLTPKGREVFEEHVLRSFVQDRWLTARFSHDAGLDLNSILQKSIQRDVETQEDLELIRYGEEPKYQPREFYGLK